MALLTPMDDDTNVVPRGGKQPRNPPPPPRASSTIPRPPAGSGERPLIFDEYRDPNRELFDRIIRQRDEAVAELAKWHEAAYLTDGYVAGGPSRAIAWRRGWALYDVARPPFQDECTYHDQCPQPSVCRTGCRGPEGAVTN